MCGVGEGASAGGHWMWSAHGSMCRVTMSGHAGSYILPYKLPGINKCISSQNYPVWICILVGDIQNLVEKLSCWRSSWFQQLRSATLLAC